MDKKNNIVLTGSHAATTALSTIKELERSGKYNVHWIGTKTAMEGSKIPTIDAIIFPKYNIPFYHIVSGRFQRKFTIWTIPSLIKVFISFIHALILLVKIRPKGILSFGGSSSYPVVVVGKILGIDSVIHEQTVVAGRANQAASKFAKKIALARESSRKYFPNDKCVVVGNPLSEEFLHIKSKLKKPKVMTLFVFGGSRGAKVINDTIEEILPQLLNKYRLIHQTGLSEEEKFINIRKKLSDESKEKYEVYGLIDPLEVPKMYELSDIIISRSGANTLSEIMAVKRPAIFIPIPWSYLNEQEMNAKYAADFGSGLIIPQKDLSGKKLIETINMIDKNWEKYVNNLEGKVSPDVNAASNLAKLFGGIVD